MELTQSECPVLASSDHDSLYEAVEGITTRGQPLNSCLLANVAGRAVVHVPPIEVGSYTQRIHSEIAESVGLRIFDADTRAAKTIHDDREGHKTEKFTESLTIRGPGSRLLQRPLLAPC